jgi:hypothetical protein
VFENRVLRRIFGPKRDEVTGEWRKLHNEEFNGLYFLLSIFRVIKIDKNEVDGACSTHGEIGGVYRAFVGKPEGMNHLEEDGRIILKWIFRKWDVS